MYRRMIMITAIKGIGAFGGVQADPSEECAILIRDRRTAEIGVGRQDLEQADRQIDGSGLFAIPGLIDAHASIAQLKPEERSAGIDDKAVVYSIARGIENGRLCLNSGVTTVRADFVAHLGLFALRDVFDSG